MTMPTLEWQARFGSLAPELQAEVKRLRRRTRELSEDLRDCGCSGVGVGIDSQCSTCRDMCAERRQAYQRLTDIMDPDEARESRASALLAATIPIQRILSTSEERVPDRLLREYLAVRDRWQRWDRANPIAV